MLSTFVESINYVTSAPFFYQAVGITAVNGIWIGAVLYNGEVKTMWKGVITIGCYAVLMLVTNIPRVYSRLPNVATENIPMAYASTVTILLVTLWYILGIIIGVITVQHSHQKKLEQNLTDFQKHD